MPYAIPLLFCILTGKIVVDSISPLKKLAAGIAKLLTIKFSDFSAMP